MPKHKPTDLKLKDKAYIEIRDLLRSGEFPVGSFISERQLVSRFKFSKTPIRVALERLERDGFVEIVPQRGVRVRGLSDKEVADHFELRTTLESWVADTLVARDPPLDWTGVQASLKEQESAVSSRDIEHYANADADFHDQLALMTGNEEVMRVIRRQRERLFRIVLRVLASDHNRPQSSLEEHYGIVEAIERRDCELASARVKEHLGWGRDFLLHTSAESEGEEGGEPERPLESPSPDLAG